MDELEKLFLQMPEPEKPFFCDREGAEVHHLSHPPELVLAQAIMVN